MKMLSGFLSMLLVVGIGGLFFLETPGGEPWLSPGDLVPDADGLQHQARKEFNQVKGAVVSTEPSTVYRWQDANGVWQFSDTPPEDMRHVQTVQVDPDRNLIKGLPPRQTEPEDPSGAESIVNSLPFPATIPMGEIPKLIEDAKNLQKLVDEREQRISEASQ